MPVLRPRAQHCWGGREGEYLARILAKVRARLQERKKSVPLAELEKASQAGPRRPSFRQALVGPQLALVAEVKRASPSAGPIRAELEVSQVVRAYEKAGARAISVLTEQDYFAGSPEDLVQAAQSTNLPILRKDFVVDPYQIYEAKVWGASAVLLIAAVLDDGELQDFARLAADLGLDVLVEAHDEGELLRALAVKDAVVGINNRDLRTFTVDIGTSVRLAGLVPPDRLVVAESGIRDHRDIERLAAAGVDAVLVGEALLRSAEVGEATTKLIEPVPVRVPRKLNVREGGTHCD